MNPLDVRTVILSYIISNGICAVVVGSLWFQDRRRLAGLGLWLADFIAQFVSLLLIALRGRIPDFISATVSNALIIGGTILLYIGLEQFVGKPGKQIHNVILLAVFIFVHAYFILVFPSLDVRTIILSLGLLVMCSQCAWLMLHRVDAEMRSITRTLGVVFLAFCLTSLVRIFVDLIVPSGNDFFHSNSLDTSLVMAYQMLFIILALGLFLMVNRRLVAKLEHDLLVRKQAEATITSLAKFPSENPNPIMRVDGNGIVQYTNPSAILLLQSLDSAVDRPAPANWQTLIMQTLDSQASQAIEIEHAGRVYECALVPIREGGYVNLYAYDITERKRAEKEIQLLQVQLREQAIRDPLTGLYNRRYLDEILERELARAQRGTLPISFAMIDIDHFKEINDAFSHVAGDAMLQKLAHQILGQVRTSDIPCRYGGDEFLVILPNVTAEISLQVAERWRRSFMGSTLPLEYGSVRSTISCGISEYPVHGKTSEELIFAADKALYRAKSEGRNRTKISIRE